MKILWTKIDKKTSICSKWEVNSISTNQKLERSRKKDRDNWKN